MRFGEGNFLRCFVDWMFHQLNKQAGFNGSVVVVQPIERGPLAKGKTFDEAPEELIDKIIRIASGEKAKHEKAGSREMAIFKSGVTL